LNSLCSGRKEGREKKGMEEDDLRWSELNGLKLFTTFPLTNGTCWVTPQVCARMTSPTQTLITAATPVHPGARLS